MAFWRLLLWAPSPLRSQRVGLVQSFANRWLAVPEAVTLVPAERFITGRIPTISEYPFPYMSLVPTTGRPLYRTDRCTGYSRIFSLHVWVDGDRLQEGEDIVEMARTVWANQKWPYNYGKVIDVLEGGPASARQVNEATFQAWELVKLFSLHIEQRRVDVPVACETSDNGSVGSASGSVSTAGGYSSSSGTQPVPHSSDSSSSTQSLPSIGSVHFRSHKRRIT